MPGISINIVLARIEQTIDENGKPASFTIEFIKDDGSWRIMRAQKHVKNGNIGGGVGEKSNFKYNLKNKGALLLYDLDAQEFRTVKIDSIIKFNNLEVIH